MRQTILDAIITSMKAKDKETLSVLRMVKGSMQLEEINLKRELNDIEVTLILSKQIKSRKDSIVEFKKGNRNDLVEQVEKEIVILEKYMPAQMSEEEIIKNVELLFKEVNPTGPQDMGKLMGKASPLFKGKADMGLVNRIIKERLSK
ncbi:MAG: GatB/YqeY domain-containing protein [Bacilli bacterium]